MEDNISSIYFRFNALKALKVINNFWCRLKKKDLFIYSKKNEKAFKMFSF